MSSDPLIALHGELLALRIVVQRLLGEMALRSGFEPRVVARAEHGQASAELASSMIIADNEATGDAIRSEAQTVLDEIFHAVTTTSVRPGND